MENWASWVVQRAKRLCESYDIAVGEIAASHCSLFGRGRGDLVLVLSKRACKLLCSDKREAYHTHAKPVVQLGKPCLRIMLLGVRSSVVTCRAANAPGRVTTVPSLDDTSSTVRMG